MPCRANLFEPIGMTSELLGEVLPIPPTERHAPHRYARAFVEYHTAAPYKKPRMRCTTTRVIQWRRIRNKKEEARGPHGSRDERTEPLAPRNSKGGRQKLHLGPTYKPNMGSAGPGLWLERPKARGTSIRKPVVEKICVVRGPAPRPGKSRPLFVPHCRMQRTPCRAAHISPREPNGIHSRLERAAGGRRGWPGAAIACRSAKERSMLARIQAH
jgi:hypothetical protein